MNMKNVCSGLLMSTLFISCLVACKEEEKATNKDSATVSSETITEAYFDEVADISGGVARSTDEELTNGRRASIATDDRICSNSITWMHQSQVNSDTIIIDFKNGCQDSRGNLRKGKLIITYTTVSRFEPNSFITVTSDGYSINEVKIEGTWSLENVSESANYMVKAILTNGKATWPDNTIALRKHTIFREWVSTDGTTNPSKYIARVWGTAEGTGRDGVSYFGYVMDSKALVYSVACAMSNQVYIPVSGEKVITLVAGGRMITLDYGVGVCDKLVNVETDGFSGTITIDN